MSLSFWIRDYVFLPLATVRREIWWRHAVLVFAMMLFGVWHGATILFVVWGVYHGLLLVGHRLLQQIQRRRQWKIPPTLLTPASWMATFALVSLGWIFFRSHDLSQAIAMLGAVFSPASYGRMALRPNLYILTLLIVVGYFAYQLLAKFLNGLQESLWSRRVFWLLSPVRYAVIIFLTIAWSKQETVFVYFQF